MSYLRGALWRHLTLVLIAVALAITFMGFHSQDAITRGVYPAIAGRTALYVAAAFGIPALVQPVHLRLYRFTPWITAALSAVVVLVEFTFWWTHHEGLGYQWIQSLHLVASPISFGDLKLPLSWMECARLGIDPYTGPFQGCTEASMNYGPGLLWWALLGPLLNIADFLGVLAVLISAFALAWISRRSDGRGELVLLFAAIAPAWTMLIDHGNLDQVIIWLSIALVALTHRLGEKRLLPWVLAALPIWILGTWKYYPFAMIVAFIPVLRIKRGWLLITAFVAAAITYLAAYWPVVRENIGTHIDMTGGVGRSTLAAFIGGQEHADKALGWPDLLILAILVCAGLWGWTATRPVPMKRLEQLRSMAVLAMAGAAASLAAVTITGVGFPYKAALLVTAIPLLSRLGGTQRVELWRATTAFLILIALGMSIEWNSLLGSLAVNAGTAFVLGLAARPLVSGWLRAKPDAA